MAKTNRESIRLVPGLGVGGDAHAGKRTKHRVLVKADPEQPNRRQVHLIHAEFHDELAAAGFEVSPGVMGENITTRGVELLALPSGARLRVGSDAVVEITGLRSPCRQLDGIQPGLMRATLGRDEDGAVTYKAGVMGIVVRGGVVRPGDLIRVELGEGPHVPLRPV